MATLSITREGDALIVRGVGNALYPNNGILSYPLNSVVITVDDSEIATFRSASTYDVLFSGIISSIEIAGSPTSKDTIVTDFAAIACSESEGGGGSGTSNYNELTSKPKINGITLQGNKTAADLSLATADDVQSLDEEITELSGKVGEATEKANELSEAVSSLSDSSAQYGSDIADIKDDIVEINNILGECASTDDVGELANQLSAKANKSDVYTKSEIDGIADSKQDELVSGTSIKTINGESLLGSGNIVISGEGGGGTVDAYTKAETDALLGEKQDNLVSGTSIKTINGESILGSGNIEVSGGGGSGDYALAEDFNYQENGTEFGHGVNAGSFHMFFDGSEENFNWTAPKAKGDWFMKVPSSDISNEGNQWLTYTSSEDSEVSYFAIGCYYTASTKTFSIKFNLREVTRGKTMDWGGTGGSISYLLCYPDGYEKEYTLSGLTSPDDEFSDRLPDFEISFSLSDAEAHGGAFAIYITKLVPYFGDTVAIDPSVFTSYCCYGIFYSYFTVKSTKEGIFWQDSKVATVDYVDSKLGLASDTADGLLTSVDYKTLQKINIMTTDADKLWIDKIKMIGKDTALLPVIMNYPSTPIANKYAFNYRKGSHGIAGTVIKFADNDGNRWEMKLGDRNQVRQTEGNDTVNVVYTNGSNAGTDFNPRYSFGYNKQALTSEWKNLAYVYCFQFDRITFSVTNYDELDGISELMRMLYLQSGLRQYKNEFHYYQTTPIAFKDNDGGLAYVDDANPIVSSISVKADEDNNQLKLQSKKWKGKVLESLVKMGSGMQVSTDDDGNAVLSSTGGSGGGGTGDAYTKAEADALFAKVWTGTQAEYNAIATKEDNMIYIVTD